MSREQTRLESASNVIDNARYLIERDQDFDPLGAARVARGGWEMFAEEVAAQLLVTGHEWAEIVNALHLEDRPWVRSGIERRADELRARNQQVTGVDQCRTTPCDSPRGEDADV